MKCVTVLSRAAAAAVLVGIVGCAKQPLPPLAPRADESEAVPARYVERGASGALAFDPPVAGDEPRVELSRGDRQPAAFVGYDSIQTTDYYLRVDDYTWDQWRNRGPVQDRYTRRAVTARAGVSQR
jgi:hypothetical protein